MTTPILYPALRRLLDKGAQLVEARWACDTRLS